MVITYGNMYAPARISLGGRLGGLLEQNKQQWLLKMLRENPALFEPFSLRDTDPQYLMPWYGEFPGKFLTCLAMIFRTDGDGRLLAAGDEIVSRLAGVIGEDGYLGPHPLDRRMTGDTLPKKDTANWNLWDVWGHYHCIYGLCLWHEVSSSSLALATARRAADFVIEYFNGKSYAIAGDFDKNMGISHGYLKLYEITGEKKYLEEAERIILGDWRLEGACDWRGDALNGVPFYKMKLPRWESLHSILALGELYRMRGEKESDSKRAMEAIWRSIRETDRHNHGGFSSGEGAYGNPFDPRAVETCCTLMWMALTSDYLRITKDPEAADELELSTLNSYPGMLMDGGRHFTYNTPMDGKRVSSTYEIGWQSVSGAPDLNCCQMNGSRGFGQIGDWAALADETGVYINYYGRSEVTVDLPKGRIRLSQDTDYPASEVIKITLRSTAPARFSMFLRIPSWSKKTTLRVNGRSAGGVQPGYHKLNRLWKDGDVIYITLDMSPHFWVGQRECEGRASVYFGPVLMAADSVMSGPSCARPSDAEFDLSSLKKASACFATDGSGRIVSPVRLKDGSECLLTDFASAGGRGQYYTSWLKCANLPAGEKDAKFAWLQRF